MEDARSPADAAEASEVGRLLFAQQCEFLRGAASLEDIPQAELPEVAFVGRSNVGKSSLVNALTGRKTLARVSKTDSARWTELIFAYLRGRPNLRRAVLLIDSRRGPLANDIEVMDLLDRAAVSYQLVLTKAD